MLGKERMKGSAQRGSRSSSPTHKSTTSSEARSSLYTYGELLHVGVGGLGANEKGIEPSRGSKGREEILQLIGTSLSASVDTYEDQQPEPKEVRTGVKPSGKSLKQDVSTKIPDRYKQAVPTRMTLAWKSQKPPAQSQEYTEGMFFDPTQKPVLKPITTRLLNLLNSRDQPETKRSQERRILKNPDFVRLFETEVTSVDWGLLNRTTDSTDESQDSTMYRIDESEDQKISDHSKSLRKHRSFDAVVKMKMSQHTETARSSDAGSKFATEGLLQKIDRYRASRAATLQLQKPLILSQLKKISLPTRVSSRTQKTTLHQSSESEGPQFPPLPVLHPQAPTGPDTLYSAVCTLSNMSLDLQRLREESEAICSTHLRNAAPLEWVPSESNIDTIEHICRHGGGVREGYLLGGLRTLRQFRGDERVGMLGGGKIVRVRAGDQREYARGRVGQDIVVLKGCIRLIWGGRTEQSEKTFHTEGTLAEIWEGQILTNDILEVVRYCERFTDLEERSNYDPQALLQFMKLKDDPFLPLVSAPELFFYMTFPVDSVLLILQTSNKFSSMPILPSHFQKIVLTMANALKFLYFHPLMRKSKLTLQTVASICDLVLFEHYKAGDELQTDRFAIVLTGRGVAAYKRGWIPRKFIGGPASQSVGWGTLAPHILVAEDINLNDLPEPGPEMKANPKPIQTSSLKQSSTVTPNASISIMRSSILREPLPQEPASISARLATVSRGDLVNIHILLATLSQALETPTEIPSVPSYKIKVLSHRMTVCHFRQPLSQLLGDIDKRTLSQVLVDWGVQGNSVPMFPQA